MLDAKNEMLDHVIEIRVSEATLFDRIAARIAENPDDARSDDSDATLRKRLDGLSGTDTTSPSFLSKLGLLRVVDGMLPIASVSEQILKF